ncbi:MAG: HD domain-containing protein [Bacteroidaceae bacterium]|nr:HD domain-containing protein [Bacteroidaceae bacterium]
MVDIKSIISKWYNTESDEYNLLISHSQQVAELAVELGKKYNNTHEAKLDLEFVYEAAMLHDIGMCKTHAPSIFCHGNLPYLRHGLEGYEMLMGLNLPRHARVCARHTGTGLTAEEISEQNLPLPHIDLLPETLEEKVICYADKFFSKSKIGPAKPIIEVRDSMIKFGQATVARFDELAALFPYE